MGRLTGQITWLIAIFIAQSTAHFVLDYPPTIGFDDEAQANPPCGGVTVDFSNGDVTDFHVDGDSIAVTSTHPEATWLFRATLDQTASGNWTNLLPAVAQTGLGEFCVRNIVVPSTWVGSPGVISVVQGGGHGFLYQCSTVNFVAGSVEPPTACTNGTGLSAAYTTDARLSSIPATAAATSSPASSAGTDATEASDAHTVVPYGGLSSVVGFLIIASATLVASFL